MTSKPRMKSLRIRLALWFLGVTMLTLAAVVTILYFQRSSIIRGREFEKLEIVRDLKIRELNLWMDDRQSDMAAVARDYEIRGLEQLATKSRSEWNERDRESADIARSLLGRYTAEYRSWNEFFFVDQRGVVSVSSHAADEGLDRRENPYFTGPMRTGELAITDIYLTELDGTPSMTLSIPVFCLEHDGEHTIGVLVGRLDLDSVLYPLLQERIGMGETGETLIVNLEGFALNELRWAEDAPLRLRIVAEPALRAAAGETGVVETEDYRDERVLAAYAYIPLMRWGFVAKRDVAEVYAPIRAMLRDMVIIGITAAVIVTLVSFFLARTISRPILSIGMVLRRFTEGDLDARWPVTGSDEVTALG
ncbi:MAG: cache and HAMP domain-containing protein, partial [Spirochaetia bacterium]